MNFNCGRDSGNPLSSSPFSFSSTFPSCTLSPASAYLLPPTSQHPPPPAPLARRSHVPPHPAVPHPAIPRIRPITPTAPPAHQVPSAAGPGVSSVAHRSRVPPRAACAERRARAHESVKETRARDVSPLARGDDPQTAPARGSPVSGRRVGGGEGQC